MQRDPKTLAAAALDFTRRRLGPASERLLADPAIQALALDRVLAGAELEDAILHLVHRAAPAQREVADEFLAFLLLELERNSRTLIAPHLRRYLDGEDLVQSVLGDVWPELAAARFHTKGEFLALLSQRLRWKASDRARHLGTEKVRADLRVEVAPEELPLAQRAASPSSLAARLEEHERLALFLARLPERERLVMRLHLRGEPLGEIARQTGRTEASARKTIRSVIERFQHSFADCG